MFLASSLLVPFFAIESPSVESLITSGGAIGILAAAVLAFYTGKLTTQSATDRIVAFLTKMWEDRFNDERSEKESWKAQAQSLAESVGQLTSELEKANQRDEEWKREMFSRLEGGLGDRRKPPL